MKAHSSDT